MQIKPLLETKMSHNFLLKHEEKNNNKINENVAKFHF